MRRLVFDAHIHAGRVAGGLVLLWSLTGALMIIDPILRRPLERAPERPAAASVDAAVVTPAALRAAGRGAAVRLRAAGARTWLEVERPDGKLEAFDARSGRPTHALLEPEEARALLAGDLAGGEWSPAAVERMDRFDYDYKVGELPAYRVRLDGPGGIVLYVSARDGSWQKTTTVWARAFKRAGMGLHTWNFESFRGPLDGVRRWLLVLVISLPCAALGGLGLLLLRLRRKAAAPNGTKKAVAAAAVVSLLLGCLPQASVAAVVRMSAPRPAAVPRVNVIVPRAGLSPTLSLAPAKLSPAVPAPTAAPAPGVVAAPLAPVVELAAFASPEAAPESFAASGRAYFDGAAEPSSQRAPVPASGFSGGGGALTPSGGAPKAPRGKGSVGLYVTHAVHMVTMSSIWRVAWPLFALDAIGKAGLAWIGSTAGLATMGGGLLAGFLVDRFLPRRSLVGSALARAALAGGIAVAAMAGSPGIAFFLAAATAHSFMTMTAHIGQSSLSPNVAQGDEARLQRINTALKLISAAVSIPGALIGGALAGAAGVSGAFAVYAAIAALALAPAYHFLLPEAARPEAKRERPEKGGFLEAGRVVLSSPAAMASMAAMALLTLMNAPLQGTTLPILAREGLSGGAQSVGALLSAFSAGQFVGILAQLGLAKKVRARAWVWLGAAGLGAFSLLTLALPAFWPTALAVAVVAALTQPASVALKTIFQKEISARRPDLLGRAMGVNNLAYELAVVAGGALVAWAVAGSLASAISTLSLAYVGFGAAVAAAAWWMGRRGSKNGLHALAFAFVSPGQAHVVLAGAFGMLVLLYAITGTVSLISPWLKKAFEAELPERPEVKLDAALFELSPAVAARALTAEERSLLKAGMPVLRAVPDAPVKRWYAFELEDGRLIEVHARTGRRMRSPRSPALALGVVRRWLAGTPWKPRPPVLVTEQGDHYRKGEVPHYRVDLDGPGGHQVFVSVKDGRILETHSRLSRFLRLTGKGVHAWAIKALDRHDTLKRLLAPLLLGLPLLSVAGSALWLKLADGFAMPHTLHGWLGAYSLFMLAFMAVTGPLTLLMPVVTERWTPKLPRQSSLGPEAFVLSPRDVAGDAVSVRLRASRSRAWYELEFADGTRRAVSAQDGSALPLLLTPEEAAAEVGAWLSGTSWTVKGEPVLMAGYDAHYTGFQDAERPVYRVELDGPKGVRLYVSARDGRPVNKLSVRTRLSRFLAVGVKDTHAFERAPARAVLMILLVTLPLAAAVILGLTQRFL